LCGPNVGTYGYIEGYDGEDPRRVCKTKYDRLKWECERMCIWYVH
jgi:hypothetical protein